MRISLRTSGGRGEYELAGSVQGHDSQEVYNKNLYFQLTPDLVINSFSMVKVDKAQGKPRLRLENKSVAVHSHILFSSILLLPKPKRALKDTPNNRNVIKNNDYSIIGVNVDVATVSPVTVLVPLEIFAGNTSPYIKKIMFAERMALVFKLWESAEKAGGQIGELLIDHRNVIHSKDFSHKTLQKIHAKIIELVSLDTDPLEQLFILLNDEYNPDPADIETIERNGDDLETIEPADTDDFIIKTNVDQISSWRKVLARGSEGRKFSEYVKGAYNYRCLFTGMRYPKSSIIKTPGVDAAHILPWAEHRLNDITNGICLNKVCHWAFDQGILKLDWIDESYVLSVPKMIEEHLLGIGFDLDYFVSLCGIIDRKNFPSNAKYWPSPEFIKSLNSKSSLE